jgi:hypothetical protein
MIPWLLKNASGIIFYFDLSAPKSASYVFEVTSIMMLDFWVVKLRDSITLYCLQKLLRIPGSA